MTRLRDIQRTLAEQADLATARWKLAMQIAVVYGIILGAAILLYLYSFHD